MALNTAPLRPEYRYLAPAAFALFAVSGFAGIIYESVWAHYLKLFLGHAAYAQTIVLVMFMGGMASGAGLASRLDVRSIDLLKVYVAVELLIGIAGILFDPLYRLMTDAAYAGIFPRLGDPLVIEVAKTLLAAMLVLPQSVLIGATFPLMTVGMMQRLPEAPGRTIANLYFVNSLGAAIGILASGFVLLGLFGLPGTVRFAGALNLAIAAALVVGLRHAPVRTVRQRSVDGSRQRSRLSALLLPVALATGAASFIYEIVWVRLLTMVLGASTHAFELMLSAFILGLALGSHWIRRHIDSIEAPLAVLGYIQLAMGTLALATLMFYDFSFALMSAALSALAKTSLGYVAFTLTSHGIALMIMLPVTICAGMTLPLITRALVSNGDGESSVGRVYAWNTLGAIAGVAAAVHFLIPVLDLKSALVVGAAIDLGVGFVLLTRRPQPTERRSFIPIGVAVLAFTGFTIAFVDVDPRKMAAGVYRTGVAEIGPEARITLRRDGKTSSVTVMEINDSLRVLSTNGKPDASIEFDPDKAASRDETTQILTGLLPLVAHPEARTAAMIGIGSAHSTAAILASPTVQRVDTIEIEAAMVEGARRFLPAVAAAFDDPRSELIINDARTIFSTRGTVYDIIVSEPSNPWVSGVSGLFSVEFYRLVKQHLAADGVFAQWMQLYEIDMALVATVFKALRGTFDRFVAYDTGSGNLLIIAADNDLAESGAETVFELKDARALLTRIGIRTKADLMARRIGDERLLMPLMESYSIAPNSDYFPHLDLGSASARFLEASATDLVRVARDSVPINDLFGTPGISPAGLSLLPERPQAAPVAMRDAVALFRWLTLGDAAAAAQISDDLRRLASAVIRGAGVPCDTALRVRVESDVVMLTRAVFPYLDVPARQELAARIAPRRGCGSGSVAVRFVHALADGDSLTLRDSASALRAVFENEPMVTAYLVETEMFANLLLDEPTANIALWNSLEPHRRARWLRRLPLRALLSQSGWHEAAQ